MCLDNLMECSKNANAIMFVYSVTDARSFEQLNEVAEQLHSRSNR